MRPSAVDVLRETALRVEREVVPATKTANDAATAMFAVFIMSAVADHWDNAAAWRYEENQTLRILFKDATAFVIDATLRTDMEREANSAQSGLRISELDAENDRLTGVLTRLDAFLDEASADASNDGRLNELRQRVFAELRAGASRRKSSPSRFEHAHACKHLFPLSPRKTHDV